MEQAIATGIIAAVAALLGGVVGRVLESRSESHKWWRDQRRDAYAQLLVSEQRFHHVITTESGQATQGGWLVVQEAAGLVELVAPDNVGEAAKQLVARSRRYYQSLNQVPNEGSLAAGLEVAQAKDRALDERIRARHTFVDAAKGDLLSRWMSTQFGWFRRPGARNALDK